VNWWVRSVKKVPSSEFGVKSYQFLEKLRITNTSHGSRSVVEKKEARSIVSTGYGTKAYLHQTNHPQWTREELFEEGMGLAFFRNGVQYI